jgi:hypothetical protein
MISPGGIEVAKATKSNVRIQRMIAWKWVGEFVFARKWVGNLMTARKWAGEFDFAHLQG